MAWHRTHPPPTHRRVRKPPLRLLESHTSDKSTVTNYAAKTSTAGRSTASTTATKRTTGRQSDVAAAKIQKNWKATHLRKWVRHLKDMPETSMPADDTLPNTYASADSFVRGLFGRWDYHADMRCRKLSTRFRQCRMNLSFLVILFNSGCEYWEPTDDVQNTTISNIMTRNRFKYFM